jgi:hypothetical protein
MSSTLQYGDMVRALGKAGATFVAHIASGATTTAIPLADLNLGSNNLANDLVLIQAGALGTGSVDTLITISSNTATVLTVPVLSAAPSAGYTVWIYRLATIQAVVTASDNIAQVGGVTVPSVGGVPSVPVTVEGPIPSGTNTIGNVALAGRFLTQSPVITVVTVGTTATLLPATPLSGRGVAWVRNAGQVPVMMCNADGSQSYTLNPGDSKPYFFGLAAVNLYAKVSTGTGTVEVEEWK